MEKLSRRRFLTMAATGSLVPPALTLARQRAACVPTLNTKAPGYTGIWYANQPVASPYRYKYSGGMATYTAKHRPFAIYAPEANRTFFCYGAAPPDNPRRLLHAVGVFDHANGALHPPTVVLDKMTDDAHDNPVLSMDPQGHIWLFSTSHGRVRPSFIHRSVRPYEVDQFHRVEATIQAPGGTPQPFDNFSYAQVWPLPGGGFYLFFTRYGDPVARTIMFASSEDGRHWVRWQRLAAIDEGHYQVSGLFINEQDGTPAVRAGTCFNYHPRGLGLNYRSNLYYMETFDGGLTWRAADGTPLQVPLTEARNPALVLETRSRKENVYLKDLMFDDFGRPVLLFLTSRGWRPGPEDGPRTWKLARWTGTTWEFETICESDNAYDMGTLRYDTENGWQLLAPVEPGPQPFNPGGEIVLLQRKSAGRWERVRQLTRNSDHNHNYVRRPVNAHPDFWALWTDGHGRRPSLVRLYMATANGDVCALPTKMDGPVKL